VLDRPETSRHRVVAIDGAVIPVPGGAATLGPYSLDLRPAEIASIVGPSGSGKTTLVKAIVERRQPLSGTIAVNAGPKEVAYVPQNASDRLNSMASALRHMRDVSPRVSRNAARDLLQRFRIPADALRRPVSTFSAGQQQRLVLLMALLRRPRLVILDEPTSALDVEMRQELALLLRKLADEEKLAVLVATHHLPFVSVISDRIWQLARLDGEAGG
jgi:ABC-type multidrug transport system ATPase subunit